MKLMKNPLSLVLVTLLTIPMTAFGKGAGTSGGLTLLEPYGARPASLGEAFSAVRNDISAFGYNPASLNSLETGQASFMYQKGLAEDAYGQLMLGSPMKNGSWGLSVGYYNGGTIDLFDGTSERQVTSQKDMTVSLGYATQLNNGFSLGLTGKYLSSELVEQYSANAFAADLGLQMAMSQRLNLGAAVQNIGTQLKFVEEGDNLPRIARLGASYMMIPGNYQTTLLLDAPYYLNEAEVRPGVGVETLVGPLAIRAGYKGGSELSEFSFGAGFLIGRSNVDYSFGLVDQLESEHRVSLSMKYGGEGIAKSEIVKKAPREELARKTKTQVYETASKSEERSAVEFKTTSKHSLSDVADTSSVQRRGSTGRQIYTIKSGDTLGKIARQFYGDSREWKRIYGANRHLLDSTRAIEVGQRIVIP